MRAGVPVIPIAVVGAEEAMPIVFKSSRRREAARPPLLPGHRQHADDGPARARRLPAREVPAAGAAAGALRRRARSGALLAQPGDGRVGAHPRDGARGPLRHAAHAAAACGSGRHVHARPRHRVSAPIWGGRVAQELEQRPDVEVVVGVDTRDPRIPLERTEFVRTDSSYSILARIVAATQVDTILHTHLIVDSTRASSRTLHEINVIGTMSLLAAAGASGSPVRKVVLKSSGLVYGARQDRPVLLPRGDGAHEPADHERRALAARGGGVPARLRRRQPARERHAAALHQRARRRPRHAVRARAAPPGRARDPRLRSPRAVRARRRRRRRARCTRPPTTCPASTTWPATATCRGARCARSCASRASRSRRGSPTSRPSRCACCACGTCRPKRSQLLRFGRSLDNTRYQQAGFRYQYSNAGTVEAFARGLRLAKTIGDKHPTYRYEREVEDFFRHSPAVIRHD